ncbi:hypothetical protein [Streptomyces sp. SBT349]|uniref:hypothetical protein n=1 Tax=Streptomyces sp. SBT349 TaxID=1580539 RepID=UPI00066C28C2|nr:hypothetical protein [Streptomyces sp. SBT349]
MRKTTLLRRPRLRPLPLFGLALVLLVLLAPQAAAVLAAGVVALAGPLALWAATQPVVLVFVVGVLAGRRTVRRSGGAA